MKFWQAIAMTDMDQLPALACKAEELGFEGVVLSDHLVTFKRQYDVYEGSSDGNIVWDTETHWPDPWVQIGYLSQITKKLRFLTAVYILPMRDPFSIAKAISTAAVLSNNRIVLGAGVGWQQAEFEILGQDFHTRGRRTDEMIEVIKKLVSGNIVEHSGEFYNFAPLNMAPGVTDKVPIYIGGISDAAIKRAARNEGWIGGVHTLKEISAIRDRLMLARDVSGRDSSPLFQIVAWIRDFDEEKLRSAEDLQLTLYRPAWLDQSGRAGRIPLNEKLREMEAFAERYM